MSRRTTASAVVVGSVALALSFVGGTANAAVARNGVCEVGEFCLYFDHERTGSVSDFAGSISNYGDSQPTCYDLKGPGYGQGQCVKNNAISAWNRTTSYKVTVYYNSGYSGTEMTYYPGTWGDFIPQLQNENASQLFRHL